MITDPEQIGFGAPRETQRRHDSASRGREFEGFANTRKNIARGDTTGVTFINRGTQGCKFRRMLLLFTLQRP